MRLLFIKLKHIGDALLLTPTLTAARAAYPQATIWVVVRRGSEGILAGCPAIDRVLTAAAPEASRRSRLNFLEDFQLLRELRRERFDYAFELTDGDRGRWLACLSGAPNRCANVALQPLNFWWRGRFNSLSTFDWRDRHRVEKDFGTVNDCLPLGATIPPLSFSRTRALPWTPPVPLTDYAVVHPATRWQRKRWPVEKWIELGRQLLADVSQLVISCGPDPAEIELATTLRARLGPRVLSTDGRLSWAQLAGLLYGARLFVGVDTAAMHLAAACQCPAVAIFGPSVVAHWRPWQVAHRLVQPPATSTAGGEPPGTAAVEVADVTRACRELLAPKTSTEMAPTS